MNDAKERLDTLRQKVATARDEKVRLEERRKAKDAERKQILTGLKELGVEEGDLDDTIAKLTRKRDSELDKAETIINDIELSDDEDGDRDDFLDE
ncbi:MAG: hypothetical protein IIC28_11970 [Chloroflexi bacterium]|nr:hypothetical protein [Chloroflexota bacterium]